MGARGLYLFVQARPGTVSRTGYRSVCNIAWHGEPREESGHIESRCQIWRTDIAVAITVDTFPRPKRRRV
jgi:hypothetical protein